MENSILNKLFDKQDNFGLNIVCSMNAILLLQCPWQNVLGRTGAEFLRISRATSKIEDLSHTCKQLLSRMLKQNG